MSNQPRVNSKPAEFNTRQSRLRDCHFKMKISTLLSAAFLIAALTLSHFPSSSEGRLSSFGHNDDMFDFARAKLDKVSTTVRKTLRVKSVAGRPGPPGKRRRVISAGQNNQYLSARTQVDKGEKKRSNS